jgi:hypothetical protein
MGDHRKTKEGPYNYTILLSRPIKDIRGQTVHRARIFRKKGRWGYLTCGLINGLPYEGEIVIGFCSAERAEQAAKEDFEKW